MKPLKFSRLFRKARALSLLERVRYRLSGIQRIPILGRISIFRNIESNLSLTSWIYWIVTGNHIYKKGFKLSNYGVWLALRPNDFTYTLCLEAKYKNNLEKITNKIDKETVFIDIGANIGVFSLVAALNPSIVSIHSFEPDLESFAFLERNILRNNAGKITPHNFAIGKTAGTSTLIKREGHSGVSRIHTVQNEQGGSSTTINMVNNNYLDAIFDSERNNIFVKIDVEGYELVVLETLREANLFPLIQDFFIEFDRQTGEVQLVEEFLRKHMFIESGRWGSNSHWDALWVRRDMASIS
jgi:FkbM family methyltransferase